LLEAQGLVATRVGIEIETEHGECLVRFWRDEGGLTAAAMAQRARWQLDGWLTRPDPPTAGFTILRLVPDEVGPAKGHQGGFWGGQRDGDERAARAFARVQGMLGPQAVVTAVAAGGREPGEQVCLVPWGDGPPAAGGGAARQKPPWPGRVPAPSPATVPAIAVRAEVVDAHGSSVNVNGRGHASGAPARLSIAGGYWVDVAAWAGPWPLDERWWDAAAHRRRARWQIVTSEGCAHLLVVEGGRWSVEATYD
jgi:protein ImuB